MNIDTGGNVLPFRRRKTEEDIITEVQQQGEAFGSVIDFDCQEIAQDYIDATQAKDSNIRHEIAVKTVELLASSQGEELWFCAYTYSENNGRDLYHSVLYKGHLLNIAGEPNGTVKNWDEYFNSLVDTNPIVEDDPQLCFVLQANRYMYDGVELDLEMELINIPLSNIVCIARP